MESSELHQASRRSVLRTSALGLGTAIAGVSLAGAQSATAAPAAAPATLPNPVGVAGRYLTLDWIPGESVAKGHEKTIEVIDASWQVDAPTSWTKGGGASVAKPNPGGLSLSINTSSATPLLLNRIASGKVIASGRLDVVRSAAGGTPVEILQLALTSLYVTSLSTHIGSSGELYDDVTFVFKAITFSVWKLNANGTQGTEVKTTWDVSTGTVA